MLLLENPLGPWPKLNTQICYKTPGNHSFITIECCQAVYSIVAKRWLWDNQVADKKQSRKGKGPYVNYMSKLELILFCNRSSIICITLLALCKYSDFVTKNNKCEMPQNRIKYCWGENLFLSLFILNRQLIVSVEVKGSDCCVEFIQSFWQ